MSFPVSIFGRPLLPALICSLLWGSSFPVIKTVFHHWSAHGIINSLPLLLLFAGVRFLLAGSGLLLVSKSTRAEIRATPWKLILGLSFTQTFLQYVFLYQAISISSASLTALLVATGSFWWMLLAPLLQGTAWPTRLQWIGLILGGLGVTLAIYKPGANAGNPLLGGLLMLAATASGAFALIIFARMKSTMSAMNATGLSLFIGGCALIAAGSQALHTLPQMFDLTVIGATLWLACVSASAFTMWNYLSTLFPVTLLASYRFLIPVCGVVESLIFLHTDESPGWGLILGGLLVITSMALARRTTGGKITP